jgi:RimJ/RimL family protein N-acetyltransferase
MKYEEVITLKDGRTCMVRNACAEDAKKVLENFNLTHAQSEYLLTYPDEASIDIHQEESYLKNKESSPDEIELCAVINGEIAGTAGIEPVGRKDKVKHRAELGISVDQKYWGFGIGRALVDACIACAVQAGYVQLELQVAAENMRAVRLYEHAGFTEYGRNPKGFRTRQGIYQELILMKIEL